MAPLTPEDRKAEIEVRLALCVAIAARLRVELSRLPGSPADFGMLERVASEALAVRARAYGITELPRVEVGGWTIFEDVEPIGQAFRSAIDRARRVATPEIPPG